MDEFEIRLECLKLAHRRDRQSAEIIDEAKAYEAYVGKTQAEKKETVKARKSIGNPDPLG